MTLIKPEAQGYTYYGPEPKFPDFPYSEGKARLDKARKLMQENNVDLLMLFKEEDNRYFTGFTTIHYNLPSVQPLVTLIPIDDEPVLILPELFQGAAEAQCWIRDIRVQPMSHQIKSERDHPKEVAAVIKEKGYDKKNIALEKGWLGHTWIPRPLNDIETLMKDLPNAKFMDGDKIIWGCRMIKSPLEIDRMKHALSINTEAHAKVVEEYRPGMTENDVGKLILHVFVERGEYTILGNFACGADKEGMIDTDHHFEGITINKGDYLWCDLSVRHKGYWSDNARIFQVGPVSDGIRKRYELLYKAFDAAAEVAKPGIKTKEVWQAVAEVEKEGGVEPFDMCGHGVGLDIHEPPCIGMLDETVLEPGMAFNIEPAMLSGFRRMGGEGVFHYEDLVVITEKGSHTIKGFRRDIIQVSHPFP